MNNRNSANTVIAVAPARGVCDFCSASNPAWSYPCADFTAWDNPQLATTGSSAGAWLACTECHESIEQDRREQLTARAIDRLGPEYAAVITDAVAMTRELHDRFFAHRQGPAVKLQTE